MTWPSLQLSWICAVPLRTVAAIHALPSMVAQIQLVMEKIKLIVNQVFARMSSPRFGRGSFHNPLSVPRTSGTNSSAMLRWPELLTSNSPSRPSFQNCRGQITRRSELCGRRNPGPGGKGASPTRDMPRHGCEQVMLSRPSGRSTAFIGRGPSGMNFTMTRVLPSSPRPPVEGRVFNGIPELARGCKAHNKQHSKHITNSSKSNTKNSQDKQKGCRRKPRGSRQT